MFLQYSKPQVNVLVIETKTTPQPSRLRLEKWEVLRPRPNLEILSLPNMQ